MAMLMTLEVPGGTTALYDRANEIMRIAGESDAPTGLIAHTCAVTDDGIVVVDVWDSTRSLDDFAQNRLGAALAEAGMPEGTWGVAPVHDLLFGSGTEPNTLVLLHALDMTTDVYDAIVAKMPSHQGDGASHPSVMHAAAAGDDGFRIAALYDSEEVYTDFAQGEMLPAVDNPLHFVLRMWPVHSCLLAGRPGSVQAG
jgi:hypothetical protein